MTNILLDQLKNSFQKVCFRSRIISFILTNKQIVWSLRAHPKLSAKCRQLGFFSGKMTYLPNIRRHPPIADRWRLVVQLCAATFASLGPRGKRPVLFHFISQAPIASVLQGVAAVGGPLLCTRSSTAGSGHRWMLICFPSEAYQSPSMVGRCGWFACHGIGPPSPEMGSGKQCAKCKVHHRTLGGGRLSGKKQMQLESEFN